MSRPVSDPWTTNHEASPSTPDMRKQRRTWHAASPHKANSPDSATPCLKITHFTKKVIVCFDVVKVGKTKRRTLKLINPHDYPQMIELERISPKKGFYLEERSWDIPPKDTLTIPIYWTPPDDGNYRDLITFLCEGAFRLQVILLGTAEETTKRVSGRRSTFLVKRQSTSKPLRPINTNNLKTKRHSMLASSNGAGKENKRKQISLGKPSSNTTDRRDGSHRGTSLAAKTNKHVTDKSQVVDKGKHLKRLEIQSQANEVCFDEKTTSQVLRELSGAEEPVKNIAVENVARETLLVCEGMSPLLKSKKFDWSMRDTSPYGSPSNENGGKKLKGTEIKAYPSEGLSGNSLKEFSKKALFRDTEVCSIGDEIQKSSYTESNVEDIRNAETSDTFDDSLEAIADTVYASDSVDNIVDDIVVSTVQKVDIDGIENPAFNTVSASDSVDDIVGSTAQAVDVDGIVENTASDIVNASENVCSTIDDIVEGPVQAVDVDGIVENTSSNTVTASDNVDGTVDDIVEGTVQGIHVDDIVENTAPNTMTASDNIDGTTHAFGDAATNIEDGTDLSQRKAHNENWSKAEKQVIIPEVDGSKTLDSDSGDCKLNTTDDEERDEVRDEDKEELEGLYENVEEFDKTKDGENVIQPLENKGRAKDDDIKDPGENFVGEEKKREQGEGETEGENKIEEDGEHDVIRTDGILMTEEISLKEQDKTQREEGKSPVGSESVPPDEKVGKPTIVDVSDVAIREEDAPYSGEILGVKSTIDDATKDVIDDVSKNVIQLEKEEEEKKGLMFIPLNQDSPPKQTGYNSHGGNKRVVEDTGMGDDVKSTKKPRLADERSSGDRTSGKGRKSSLSLNRTVALRRAAATNSSVSVSSRTKPKVKRTMKGVPMSKLNLIKPSRTVLPRHPMPFAAKNMFYDERWVDKQERGFVQWLNYVLTPEDVGNRNPTIKGTKIEASTLAVSSSSTSIKRAPTKEVLSLRAYTARRRLNQLRRASCLLFQSEPVVRVIQKLEALVENRGLTVRSDRKIHADLGMKQNILLMILCYNPLWLRIGLETIYGELLPVEDNSDIVGLSRFIVTRLLGNPDIAALYAHPTVPALFRPGYEAILAKFTLKKFLLLVFFLDRAKLTRLIDHDPCLFCKDAQYKSSRDLLLEFSRLYLKGEGDITRHLNYIGYSVTHTQKALDEYDFAVVNLAKDLRDGVRLVRVTELLTKNWMLSHDLRCPAISRLQKIHNVQVALRALSQCTDLSGCGVDAKSIVEGHREKTLQLLWRIIFSFKVETMIDETKLKEETVFLWNNLKLKRKLDAVKMLSSYKSAGHGQEVTNVYFKSGKLSLLLKWCQAVCAYYSVQVENFTVSFCDGRVFCYLVHHYHPELIPLSSINNTTTQTENQKDHETNDGSENDSFDGTWARSYSPTTGKETSFDQLMKNEQHNFKTLYQAIQNLGGVPFMIKSVDMSGTIPDEKVVITYTSYLCARLLDLCHETRAVRTIQMAWRNYQLRKQTEHLKTLNRAATVIQQKMRGYLKKRYLQKIEEAVIILQTAVRGWMARKELLVQRRNKRRRQEVAAAVILQSHYRRLKAQRLCSKQLRAMVKLQAIVRGRRVRQDVLKMKKAVLLIEDCYTSHKQRNEMQQKYRETREAVISIQAFYRGMKARRLYREIKAAQIIQARWKGYILRQRYQSMKKATVLIQSVWRMYLERKRYTEMKVATRQIQDWYRAIQMRNRERSLYLVKCDAVRKIQAFYRGFKARKMYVRQRSSCIMIQATVKRYLARKKYQHIRHVTIRLQRRHRANRQAQQESQRYKDLKEATTTIQAFVRGWLARKQLQKKKQAVCLLQAHVRGLIQRRQYTTTRQACVTLQCNIRCYQQRQRYLALKRSVLLIQRVFRGQLARRQVKAILSAVKIQATYRMYKARRQYRAEMAAIITCQAAVRCFIIHRRYVRLLAATKVIQKHLRGWLEMQKTRDEFCMMKSSCITIQSAYRGYVVRRQYLKTRNNIILCQSLVRTFLEKKRYQNQRNAAIILQRRYRAQLAERSCRANYCQQRQACIVLQTSLRKYMCRKQYLALKSAAVVVQSYRRMVVARERYQATLGACRIIQRRWREILVARQQRKTYLQIRHAAVVFQRYYRGLVARRHVKYIRNIVKCQSAVRRFIQQQKYRKKRNAAIKIQAFVRGQMSCQRYLQQRAAVMVIQERWRSTLRCRHDYLLYHVQRGAVIALQSAVRGWFVRKDLKKKRESAVIIQSMYRRHRAMRSYHQTQEAVITLQRFTRAYIKGMTVRKQYLMKRESAVSIQSWWRMLQRQGEYRKMRRAAITLQAGMRMVLQYRQYHHDRNLIIKIQRRWRTKRLTDEEKRRYLQMKRATITLQAWVRGMAVRNRVQLWHESATKIEAYWKGFRERRSFLVQRSAAIKIQRRSRAHQSMRIEQKNYWKLKRSAITIQAMYRGMQGRRLVQKHRAARLIQATYRMYKTRKDFQRCKKAAIIIQATFRCKMQHSRYLRIKWAAEVLQKYWRSALDGKIEVEKYQKTRQAVITVQSAVRGWIERKQFVRAKKSAVMIQSMYRRYRAVRNYQITRDLVIKTQRRWRANKLAQVEKRRYMEIKRAVITLQAWSRGMAVRKTIQSWHESATKIEAYWRGFRERQSFLLQRSAALKIQRQFRAHQSMRTEQVKYQKLRRATITIQAMYRGMQGRRLAQKHRAARLIQATYRMYKAQRDFQRYKKAAVTIQATFRCNKQHKTYMRMKWAAGVLQKYWRSAQDGRMVLEKYQRTRQAVVTVQSAVRGWIERKQFVKAKLSAIIIQSMYRRYRAMRNYQITRDLVIKTQRRWRANKLAQVEKRQYLEIKRATITLQAWSRGMAVRKTILSWHESATKIEAYWRGFRERQSFLLQRSAVVTIQRRFRAHQSMRTEQLKYQKLKRATITIQAMYRGMQGRRLAQKHRAARLIQATYRMYKARRDFQRYKKAAVTIQATFRCNKQHKIYMRMKWAAGVLQKYWRTVQDGRMVLEKYQKTRQAVVTVQSAVRGWIERKQFVKAKLSAIMIQSMYRRYRAMRNYQITRDLVIKTQRRWRANKLAQVEKRRYLEIKRAVITLQAWSRGMAVRKTIQSWHESATKIEAYWRGFRERRSFLVQRSAALKIQRRFRAHQSMRTEQVKYQKLRRATITIQAMYRGMQGRRLAQKHRAARLIQATYRMYKARRDFQRYKKAAVTIQATFRCNKQHKTYMRMKWAAGVLQKYWRLAQDGRMVLEKYQKTRQAVVTVQSAVRGWIERKQFVKAKQSAIIIQSMYRRYRAMRNYQITRDLVIKTQRRWRANKLAQVEKRWYLEMKRAAITLQAWSRGMAVRKTVQLWRESATKIEAYWRGFRERRSFLVQRSAVVTIQRQFRAHQSMRTEQLKYQKLRRATITIQAMYRGMQGRRLAQKHRAARLIQATYRMYKAQRDFQRYKRAAVLLQATFRAHRCRTSYKQTLSAGLVLQQHIRAYLKGKHERAQLRKKQNAAIIIQSYYRRYTCRKNFTKQRKAAVTLQSFYRCYRQQTQYNRMRWAAGKIQAYWRATNMMRGEVAEYQRKRDAVVVIQASVRCYLIHQRYCKMRQAAITIQTAWRSVYARKSFVAQRKAATLIQRQFRAQRMARECRTAFIAMKASSVTIQTVFRMYRCRKQFMEKKSAAVVIQARFRGHRCLQKYQGERKGAVVIQRWYRNILLTRRIKQEYEVMSLAALRVQSIWRGNRDRKKVKQLRWEMAVAKEKLDALIKIQTWTRSRLERMRFVRLCQATLLAQRLYRKRYQKRLSAVIVLQSYCRTWLAKSRLQKMQSAAVTLQSIWRGRKVRVSVKSKKIARARLRCIKACKAATDDKKLCNLTTSGLHFLLTYKHLHQVVEAVCSLEVATRLSARCCERLVAGQAVPVLFRLVKNCNRSLPCMEVITYVVATLVNLAKYTPTAPSVLECSDAVTSILDLMMIYRETNPLIFTKAAMLLTVLSQEENLQKILLATPKIDEKLRSLLNLQERKLKLKTRQMITKSKSRGMSMTQAQLMTPSKRKRPVRSFQPDWILGRYKRQDLEDPIEALRCLMGVLNMKC